MTIGEVTGATGLLITLLALICGAAWWMSALYGRVGGIGQNVTNIAGKLDTVIEDNKVDKAAIWKAIHESGEQIHEIDVRVTRVEERCDPRKLAR